jgi:hypothetical protein
MIDLDAIEAGIAEGEARNFFVAPIVKELIAELREARAEALGQRAEASYLRACVPPTRPTDYGHEVWTAALRAEVAAERAAVLEFLRNDMVGYCACCGQSASDLDYHIDIIERGEHRREEGA